MKRDNNLVQKIEESINEGSLNENQHLVKELIRKYESATYKEYEDRYKFYQDELSTMVNDTLFEASVKLAKKLNDVIVDEGCYLPHI